MNTRYKFITLNYPNILRYIIHGIEKKWLSSTRTKHVLYPTVPAVPKYAISTHANPVDSAAVSKTSYIHFAPVFLKTYFTITPNEILFPISSQQIVGLSNHRVKERHNTVTNI